MRCSLQSEIHKKTDDAAQHHRRHSHYGKGISAVRHDSCGLLAEYVNQHATHVQIRPNHLSELSSKFLNSYSAPSERIRHQRQIDNFQAGGNPARPSTTVRDLGAVSDPAVPKDPSQNNAPSARRCRIWTGYSKHLEALIAKKRAIKQAAMQQLLTGKTRLPGFSGEWVDDSGSEEAASIRNHNGSALECTPRHTAVWNLTDIHGAGRREPHGCVPPPSITSRRSVQVSLRRGWSIVAASLLLFRCGFVLCSLATIGEFWHCCIGLVSARTEGLAS